MPSAAELKVKAFETVGFALSIPEYVRPDLMHVDQERLQIAARLLGSKSLRVVTEVGPVSDRIFGASLTDNDWTPSISNTVSNRRDVEPVRTAAGDTSTGTETDWIILNTAEIQDRFQAQEHRAHSLRGMIPTFIEVKTVPIQVSWSRLANAAIRSGIKELAEVKRSDRSISVANYFMVRWLASTKAPFVHAHTKET